MRRCLVLVTVAAVTSATTACQRDAGTVRADTTRPASGDTAHLSEGPLSDRGVVTLLSHINSAEVSAAMGALPKLADPRVRAYALRMVADHGALDSAIKSRPLGVAPVHIPPEQAITMQAASKHLSAVLATMPAGPAFDRTYVASQVTDHMQALDSLQLWRGAVGDPAVRTMVDGALARVQEHLQDARALQSALGGGVDTATSPRPAPRPPTSTIDPGPPGGQPADTAAAARPSRPDTTRQSPRP